MEIPYIEMFSGIGGVRLGLEKANQIGSNSQQGVRNQKRRCESRSEGGDGRFQQKFRCVWANDNDKHACQVYRKNFGNKELVEGDIRAVDPSTIPDHDLLTAGFPCQSFSLAGKRKGFEDTRGTLFYDIARIADAKRPRLLLLENVKGLLSNNEGRTFAKILQTLDELGYDIEWQVLNSKHFGVPQNRERVFIVGHLRGTGTRQIFPIGTACEQSREAYGEAQGKGKRFRIAGTLSSRYGKDGSENLIQVGELWKGSQCRVYDSGGLSPTLHKTGGNTEPLVLLSHTKANIKRRTQNRSNTWTLDGTASKQAVIVADRTRTYAGKGRNLEKPKEVTNALSGVQKDNLVLMNGHPNGRPRNTLRSGRTPELGVANTVDCDGYLRSGARPRDEMGKPLLLPIGYRRIRRLTPIECERLQGFPDGWTDGVSDTQRYKLLGNAVTTNVIEFLGRRLIECLRS